MKECKSNILRPMSFTCTNLGSCKEKCCNMEYKQMNSDITCDFDSNIEKNNLIDLNNIENIKKTNNVKTILKTSSTNQQNINEINKNTPIAKNVTSVQLKKPNNNKFSFELKSVRIYDEETAVNAPRGKKEYMIKVGDGKIAIIKK